MSSTFDVLVEPLENLDQPFDFTRLVDRFRYCGQHYPTKSISTTVQDSQ